MRKGELIPIRLLIASPVQQRPAILQCFLESLARLKGGRAELSFLFYDDNEDPASRTLLREFEQREPRTAIIRHEQRLAYIKDETTHYWRNELVDKVAAMKDAIIEHALEHAYDGLFLIDSDVLVHPDTLTALTDTNKEIIAALFWTKWQPDAPELPQVWMTDEYGFVEAAGPHELNSTDKERLAGQFLKRLRVPGVYEVGGLGACTLIRRSALLKGVRFKRLPNLSFWGEDRHFCVRAAALDIRLFVDTRSPAFHIYREADLERGRAYLRADVQPDHPPGVSISLCMIVKNEEQTLGRCLSSIDGVVDEIVIVDTGSTDRTKHIAGQFGAVIRDFAWIDDFAAARNFAFAQATKDYILWLDADDVVEAEDRQKLLALKATMPPDVDSVLMDYHLAFQENGQPSVSLKRNRLVRRACGFRWIGAVHEYLDVSGRRMVSDIAVAHRKEAVHTDRNLRIYRKRAERGEPFVPRDLYYYANELKDHGFYEEAAEQYEAFLATQLGWVEDRIAACLRAAECYGSMYERDLQLRSLFRSMSYDRPRAECCCSLGMLFMGDNLLQQAIFWFETATRLGDPPNNGALTDTAAWTWFPYLQLCVCYDRLGRLEEANACNEQALRFYPDHPSMLHNKHYLQEKLTALKEG